MIIPSGVYTFGLIWAVFSAVVMMGMKYFPKMKDDV